METGIGWPLGLILFDLWMCVWQVLNHKLPRLWRYHAVHHADREVHASTALRLHADEIILLPPSGLSCVVRAAVCLDLQGGS